VNRRFRAAALWRGSATVDAPPASLAIETTTHCNLDCAGCLRRWDTMPALHMDEAVYDAAVAWPGVESALIYGLGEPLLDPNIFPRIEQARQRGLFVQVSTNATLLNAQRRAALLAAKPDIVIFSLDAADPDLYRQVRGNFDFAKVLTNVNDFAAVAAARDIACVVQMVLLPENRHALAAFKRTFRDVKGVTLRFKADETLPRRTAEQRRANARACPVLFAGPLFVRVDGSVLPCCHMLDEEPLGNVTTHTYDELWQHPRLQELRVLHGAGRINEISACRKCSLPLPPRALAATALLLPPATFRRALPLVERFLG